MKQVRKLLSPVLATQHQDLGGSTTPGSGARSLYLRMIKIVSKAVGVSDLSWGGYEG